MKYCKMGDFSYFQEDIVGARLAGAFATKTVTSLGVYRAAVPKVITTYTNHGGCHQLRGIVVENQNYVRGITVH